MFWRGFNLTMALLLFLALGRGTPALNEVGKQVRAFTRPIEFDYVEWTLEAAAVKLGQAALGGAAYLDEAAQRALVLDYVQLVREIQGAEAELSVLLAHPDAEAVSAQSEELRARLEMLYAQRRDLAPRAESILQAQLAAVVAELGLAPGGQPIPPVLYHSTPLPWALIVSPRERIEQAANISLETELSLDEHIALEEEVAQSLDMSTLVVPVGGIGSYPTMVAQSSDLNWIAEVVAHEWMHNYLTLRPLGLLYDRNQELRTMNETTATLAGKEIGAALMRRFYPELAPAPSADPQNESEASPAPASQAEAGSQSPVEETAPVFDFRAEMHSTRIRVDALLAQGHVAEAEEYMEARRLFFWENGHPIRVINQAYFAFYGSYADTPTGPAGEDPVGEAVRNLRARSPSLKEFVNRMAFFTTFEQLQDFLTSQDDGAGW